MATMSPVVHFEMPAEDRRRMALFYEKTFGWKTQMLGPDMGDYVIVTTAGCSGRRHQWRLLPEEARLAGAIPVDCDRSG